jgi:hypothetical protein
MKPQYVRKKHSSIFKKEAVAHGLNKVALYITGMNINGLVDMYINLVEDEQTAVVKAGKRTKEHSDK